MSAASRRIAMHTPHRKVVLARRQNYAFLAERLASVAGVTLLRPALRNGVCPLSLPIVVDDANSLQRRLASERIGTELFWSDFHPALPARDFPEATYLKTHVVTLPIHQDLDPRLLERVVEVVRDWART
jgi:dTDP-4-amino-4,6-dideoxygalactose transaminase